MAKRFLPVSYADTADIHVPVYSYPYYFAKKIIFLKMIYNSFKGSFFDLKPNAHDLNLFEFLIEMDYENIKFFQYLWNKNIRLEIRSKPKLYAHAQKVMQKWTKYTFVFICIYDVFRGIPFSINASSVVPITYISIWYVRNMK